MTDCVERLTDSPRVVIAFASEDQTKFQWGRYLTKIGVSHVLIRDSLRRWYQDGVESHPGRDALISYVRGFRLRGHHVTTLGLSAGAYAALLYGRLAGVHRIIAISPVTGARAEDFDPRWAHRFVRSPGDPEVEDLRPLFVNGHRALHGITAFVTDGPDGDLDHHMAARVGIADIRLVPGYDHATLARGVRDNGMLEGLLT